MDKTLSGTTSHAQRLTISIIDLMEKLLFGHGFVTDFTVPDHSSKTLQEVGLFIIRFSQSRCDGVW